MLYLIVLAFLVSRLLNLTIIPIFTDEAMYLRWAQIGLLEPKKYLFISLIDGKQPLFIWLTYPFIKILSDPLVAGRLISVLAGLGSLLLIYLVTKEVFNQKQLAIMASLLYFSSPFTFIYDRLALMDGLLGTLFLASIYGQIKLAKENSWPMVFLAGIAAGLGLLTKSSASFFLLMSPLSLIIPDLKEVQKNFWPRTIKYVLAELIALLISLILYFSPLHGTITLKNSVFILTLQEFLNNPFYLLGKNLSLLGGFLWQYLTFPVVILIGFALLFGIWQKDKRVLYFFVLWAIPFFSLTFFGKIVYPRFIFFMVMPLFIVAAFGFFQLVKFLPQKTIAVIVTIMILFPSCQNSWLLLTQPVKANIPKIDSEQLLNSWPAGYGIKETITYLKSRGQKRIFVGTEGTQGLFPYALELYLLGQKNITIKGYWPVTDIPEEVRFNSLLFDETYFIYKDTLFPVKQIKTEEIIKVQRGIGDNYFILLRVIP